MIRHLSFFAACLCLLSDALAQAPNSGWVYPSATGNLLYQLDERGQRILDFSNCGYRGGTEPLPNVSAVIPQNRWVFVNPGPGDDTALIQAAINSVSAMTPDSNGWRGVVFINAGEYQLAGTLTIAASGVVLKGAGNSSTTGTRLRATDARQYSLINVSGSGNRSTVGGTTRNLTQKLVPFGSRSFQVDSVSGLAVGHTVIVKRPSTANWIAAIDMDQLGPASGGGPEVLPWTAGSKDLLFDRVITRISGTWITVDAPLPQTFESQYGGGQIWRYNWTGRIEQVGIEDIYGFSDYANSTDEAHGWTFIEMGKIQNGWVRNIISQYFGYSAVVLNDGGKWLTVADSQCLDPISIITGSRRYSFDNEGAELTLFLNDYARQGRHDFVMGSTVSGPNAVVQCKADSSNSDTGPHHRWSVGGLYDNVTIGGNEINIQNRGNYGTGHGWAGANMAVWNSVASGFRVRNPATARNWLVGSIGPILPSTVPVGADPEGTYDSSGPTGKAVYPRSLYHGQLQQRLKWPDSEFRENWLGDIDQFSSTGGTGETVNCNATWLTQVQAVGTADSKFDSLVGNRRTAFTFDFTLDPGQTVVAASLTVSLRATGAGASTDGIYLDSIGNLQTYADLGWNPVSTTASTVRTLEVDAALLADGRLNVALGPNSVVDYAVLHFQVQKAHPPTYTVTLTPEADAYVRAGNGNDTTNYGTETTLLTKDITTSNVNRESFLRWNLGALGGKLIDAEVRLAGTSSSQAGNESSAAFVSDDSWEETSITFNNKPSSGNLFAQWLPVTGQAVQFNVTPQVVDTLLTDGKLSLRILSTGDYGASGNVTYASRENATTANRPQLILTFLSSNENLSPTISAVSNQTIDEDSAIGPLAFTIGDDLTPAGSLTVAGTSSNLTLVPPSNIIFSGSGANRSVTVTPAANQFGTATITLTVSDGSLTANSIFILNVNAVNDAPVANPGTGDTTFNQPVDIDLGLIGSDVETPPGGLVFRVNGEVNGSVILLADGRTARFTPADGYSGPASFGYTVTEMAADPRTLLNYNFQPPDVTSDGFCTDVSGQSRDGTLNIGGTGALSYVSDAPSPLNPQQNQSIFLAQNGADGAARIQRNIPPATELNFQTADWTFSGWVKRNTTTDQDIILHLGTGNGRGGTNDFFLGFGNGSDNSLLYLRNWNNNSSGANDVNISSAVSPAVWHHLAVVRANTVLQLYVDGLPAASDNSFTFTFDPASPAIFGAGSSNIWDRWFNGSMADLALFSSALSAPEITRLATAPVANFGGQSSGNTVSIQVGAPPSTDAGLSALVLDPGILSPVFSSGNTSYTANVSNATFSLNLTPTVSHPAATLTVNGSPAVSGSPADIPLEIGSNTIPIVVTAEDGTTTQTYSVVATRQTAIESWRQFHFQTPGNSGDAADSADPDGDGLTNTQEYIFGTLPTTPEPGPLMEISRSGEILTLTFTAKQAAGTGYSGLTRHYTVESSTDIATPWIPVPGYSNITGAGQEIIVSIPLGGTRGFYHLSVNVQ